MEKNEIRTQYKKYGIGEYGMFDMINNTEYDAFGEHGFSMLAQEFLSPKAILKVKIQSKIAEFLALKEKLMRLQMHKNFDIVKQANKLIISQNVLENDLSALQPITDRISQGLYSFTDIAKITAVGTALEFHIQAVKKLLAKAGELPELPSIIPKKTLLLIGGSLLALFIGYRIIKR